MDPSRPVQVGGGLSVTGDLPGQLKCVIQRGRCPLAKDTGGFTVRSHPDDISQSAGCMANLVPSVENGQRMPCIVVAVELHIPVVVEDLGFTSFMNLGRFFRDRKHLGEEIGSRGENPVRKDPAERMKSDEHPVIPQKGMLRISSRIAQGLVRSIDR